MIYATQLIKLFQNILLIISYFSGNKCDFFVSKQRQKYGCDIFAFEVT